MVWGVFVSLVLCLASLLGTGRLGLACAVALRLAYTSNPKILKL